MLLYSITIFGSAFLLFLVQPMIARIILPWYGGAAAVWSTCLLFFQVMLALGYLYAHWLIRRWSAAFQSRIHVAALAGSLLLLPILPKEGWKPTGAEDPALSVLLLLAVSVGLPYFLLSATSPLLQAGYAQTKGEEAYRRYALSNAGSLLALLAYPLGVEPELSVRMQALGWSAAYAMVAVSCAAVALGARGQTDPESEPAEPPSRKIKFLWLALPACSSALLLAVTYHLSQNIAAFPMLWILPLALYLLSFVACFAAAGFYHRGIFLRLLAVCLGLMAFALPPDVMNLSLVVLIPLFLTGLLVCCIVCHGELARLKPHPSHLTSYYLMISLGGALGACLVAFAAPRLLSGFYELHISMGACAIFVLVALRNDLESAPRVWRSRPAWVLILAFTVALLASLFSTALREGANALTVRNFYGVLRVVDYQPLKVVMLGKGDPVPREPEPLLRRLMHGTIEHGAQYIGSGRSRQPISYYGRDTGVGLAVRAIAPKGPLHVGVIGLGIGTMAGHGRPGDVYTFYEINPLVRQLAETEFTYLKESAAKIEIVMGDGRLSLERQPPQGFDLLAVDAFSGDAIPVHLLTREAFELYFRHLKPGGVLAVHISNNYLNLQPVVETAAAELKKTGVVVINERDGRNAVSKAQWILLSDRPDFYRESELVRSAVPLPARRLPRPWTDDYSNLVELLKWTM